MSISEKPLKIEFIYTPNKEEAEGMDPVVVEFFYDNDVAYVKTRRVDGNKEEAVLLVSFMTEVVDFLRSKGVITKGANIRSNSIHSAVDERGALQLPTIPVTQIETKEEEAIEKDYNIKQVPFSSFEVPNQSSQNEGIGKNEEKGKIIVGGEIKEEDVGTMKNRKVIKSNSVEGSASIRGDIPDDKKIKRS
ncbi:hypothetical protein LCGC14_2349740 [marine sediment metagenome]|uniref:Uncharacterized protein n=1 Tax=marine sediment metagenome TaxID=412755 RepID=A0A0F9F4M0_9ZZZZ